MIRYGDKGRPRTPDEFLQLSQAETKNWTQAVATETGDWIVKGFIDIHRRIYALSVDTKVVSKVLELLLHPVMARFGDANGFDVLLAPQQNFYPDFTFVSRTNGTRFAVDIKSTYRVSETHVSGMTLGAFTGYFRNRDSAKNTLFPYQGYAAHFALGVIYAQRETALVEQQTYRLDDLESIPSAIRGFVFFAQPKYRIASASPGSGNTKNIGSVVLIEQLLAGAGPFAVLGEDVYDDYWMYYLTGDMALAANVPRPYNNLKTYLAYKQRGKATLEANARAIQQMPDDEAVVSEESEE